MAGAGDAARVVAELAALADPARAKFVAPYLGVVPGRYGEGDVLLGIPVPTQRKVARGHRDLPLGELKRLLSSDVHEERFVALAILTGRYERVGASERARLTRFYLDNRDRVNNWDLVDASARIMLSDRLRAPGAEELLDGLASSASLWDRRIAMVATLSLIREGEFDQTLRLAGLLLEDGEDLIQKATGWMLREVGKRDVEALRGFLDRHAGEMPRTMLRYSLERLPAPARKAYMAAR